MMVINQLQNSNAFNITVYIYIYILKFNALIKLILSFIYAFYLAINILCDFHLYQIIAMCLHQL